MIVACCVCSAYAPGVARRFGENLKRVRERLDVKQEQLQRRLKLKRQSTISAWETRETVPLPRTIRRIAKALPCETWELLEDVETEYDVLRRKEQKPGTVVAPFPKSGQKRRGRASRTG